MIINLPMKSHRSPSILPRIFFCATILAALAAPSLANEKKAPPPKSANQYAAYDAHTQEHVTIAADPCTDSKDCPFFRLPYIQHGFIPIRVIITNDSDTALSLEDARIQFISINKDVIPAATLDDINRRLFSTHNAMGTKVPLYPFPIHHAPVDKKITDDDNDFGFQGTTVNPHSTLAGYLFYDIHELDDPALKGAELYLKMIHTIDGKRELFNFSIPFDKWLAANAENSQKPSIKN
jgi:hypothetical protein